MAKVIARSSPSTAPSHASTPVKRPLGGAKPPALAKRARRVAAGDVADTRDGASVQASRVARATERTQTVAAMALSDLLLRREASDVHAPGNFVDPLKALVGGAAPDEVKALRRLLFDKSKAQPRIGTDPDAELAPNWRDGSYPYKNLMARRS